MNQSSKSAAVLSVAAPAKINLFLKVLGRRDDGYHDLQTAFQFVSWSDTLHFTPRQDEQICLKGSATGSQAGSTDKSFYNSDNLILQAAQALKTYAQASNPKFCQQGVDIELDKALPIGGGIGGGSSNAATTLLVLNKLWGLDLSLDQLADLGITLGADVPVFIYGHSAFAEGKGERLQEIQLPEYWYVLLKPKNEVSTVEIFQHQRLTRDSSPRTIRAFLAGGHRFKDLKQLVEIGNDCEKLVRELYPSINTAIECLSEHSPARLTGTGACVFAPFESEKEAEDALRALQNLPTVDEWLAQGQVVKGLNQSPLHAQLGECLV